MFVTSQNYAVENTGTSLRFVFPYREYSFSTSLLALNFVAVLVFIIAFAGFISRVVIESLQSVPISFAPFLVAFFLLFIATIINSFVDIAWRLNGKEIVDISNDSISIRHQVFVLGFTKKCDAEKIPCIVASQHKDSWYAKISAREARFNDFRRGKIAFNCGKTFFGAVDTCRFGSSLDSGEARQVIGLIHQYYPRYRCAARSAG